MKKLRPFLALLLACWLLVLPALADGEVGGDTGESPSVSDDAGDRGPSSSEEAPSEDPPAPEGPGPAEEDPSGPGPDDTPDTSDPEPVDPEPVDPEPVDPEPVDPEPVDPGIVGPLPTYPVPDTSMGPGLQELPGIDEAPAAEEHQVFTITTIPEFARALIRPDAEDTISQALRDLFGTYTPRVQTVTTYMDGEVLAVEEQYVPGVAGMDWEWIAGVAVFLLLIYCLFRLLGGAVKYG